MSRITTTRIYGYIVLAAIVFVTGIAETSSQGSPSRISVESCRQAGFDPFQLSCSVCDVLPETVTEKCKSCCLPYKTLEKRSRPYQYAFFLVPYGVHSEFDDFVDQDLDKVRKQKGDRSVLVKKTSPDGIAMFRFSPAIIFFFDNVPPKFEDIAQMESQAAETIVLDAGWKRDDIRDMMLSLLPDV